MVKELGWSEIQRLCDLRAKCGAGDLLDFIHFVKRTAKENGWSVTKVLEICEAMPFPDVQEEEP